MFISGAEGVIIRRFISTLDYLDVGGEWLVHWAIENDITQYDELMKYIEGL